MTKKVDSTKKARGEGTRRHKGEGTIYQRSDGKWCAQVSSGRDEHGKRLRRSVIGDTPEDVIKKKQELEHAINVDEYVERNHIGIHDLTQVYLCDFKLNSVSSRTYKWYCDLAKNIYWRLPNKSIQDLSFRDVQSFLNCLARPGNLRRPDGEKLKPLSQKTIKEVYRLFKQVTAFATENKLISKDPCKNKTITMPDVSKLRLKAPKAIPLDVCQQLLEKINASPTYKPIINTLFHTGLRIGEVIALDWSDLRFNDTHLIINIDKAVTLEYEVDESGKPGAAKTVRALPKSETSIRFVPMDNELVNILLEWRELYCKKFNSKSNERDFGEKLVFPNRYGVLRSYSSFRRQFIRFLEEHCLTTYHVTFHRFRHTFATLLIQKGVDARTVQELLGHADVETTLKEYRDVTDSDKRRASDIVEGVFSTLGVIVADENPVRAG